MIAAVLQHAGQQGAPYLEAVSQPPMQPLRESLALALQAVCAALEHFGVLEVHTLGLACGLRDEVVGPAYLKSALEPTLACVETRLGHHIARGDLPPCDVRVAALCLLSPILLGALHQGGACGGGLGGRALRPLSLPQLCEEVLTRFLRAYSSPSEVPTDQRA